MSFYPELRDLAGELLGEFGMIVTITHDVPNIDPVTGAEATGGEYATGSFTVMNPPASSKEFEDWLKIDSSLTMQKFRLLVVSASDAPFEPKAGDTAQFGGHDWYVVGTKPISPAGTALVYKIGLKLLGVVG